MLACFCPNSLTVLAVDSQAPHIRRKAGRAHPTRHAESDNLITLR